MATFRRRFSRFLPDDPEIWLVSDSGLRVRGEVVNESYGGLGIECAAETGLETGWIVLVEFQGGDYKAEVVSLRQSDEYTTQVGIKWLGQNPDEPEEPEELEDFLEEE